MKALAILLCTFNCLANETLTFAEIKRIQLKSKSLIKSNPTKKSDLVKELSTVNKKLEAYREYARIRRKRPIMMKASLIAEADYIGAETTLAIMATSTIKTTVLSNLKGVDLPDDAKIICKVYAKYKRICGECTRIIINGVGHDIEAELNNKDGSSCVIGEISDDKEKYMTGILISEMAQGALAISQSSTPTIIGNIVQNTARNKINQGLQNTGRVATDLMKDEFKTSEAIITLAPNSPVVLLFKKGFEL